MRNCVKKLPFTQIGQRGGDLGEDGVSGSFQRRIAPGADFGQAEGKHLNLVLIEHLWRQCRVFHQAIAKAALTFNLRPGAAQRVDVTIDGSRRYTCLLGQTRGRNWFGEGAHGVQQSKKASGTRHEPTDGKWQLGLAMEHVGGESDCRRTFRSRNMTLAVTTHLNFGGQARAALDFYKQVFGGEQSLMSYGEMGQPDLGRSPDHIIWGQVAAEDGFRIMAFDVRAGQDHDAGVNAFYVSLRGSSADEIRQRWAALADGATIQQPIGPSAWSPLYGMLTDRFGVIWIVDVDPRA